MKKIYLPLSIIALLFCGRASAQDWVTMMKDGKTNVHDVQAAFYKWHNAHTTATVKDNDKDKPGVDNDEDGNYELFKRWESFMVPRTYPSGNIPDQAKIAKDFQDYLAAHSHDRTIDRTMAAAKWSYAGISNVPKNGEAGRVNRVRFDPTNSSTIYACCPSGGLWKSINGGKNWSCNTDELADLGTSDVAIDPSNTNIMYLATGDGDGIGGGETTPSTIGVLKSTNGGKTWSPTGLYYTLQTSGPSIMTVNQLLINPTNPNIVLAATSFGLYITMNAGLSWYETQTGNIKDMEFEPSHPSIVYASTATAQFYRSTDGGQSFKSIAIPSSSGSGRMSIAVTPADSNYVYLLADNSSTSAFEAVWLSTDRGQTFTQKSTSPNLLGFSPTGSDNQGQGWYTLSLAASPTNANEIIVGGVNVWRSTNNGASWKLNADQTGTGAPYVHADIHNLTYVPSSGTSYYAACDGGVFETTNSGTNWTDYSNGLEIAEQYSIGLSGSSATLWLTGWQDNGTNLANAGVWNETMGGDGMVCFIDNTNNSNMYGEQYQGNFNRSTNGGGSWKNIAISTTESAGWVTPWCQDPTTANTLYAGYENVWKSTNQGTSWSAISTWGSSGVDIVTIAVAPSNDKYIYAATTSLLEMTSNGGTTWKNITSGISASGAISCIAVDPKNPSRVWVTLQGYTAGATVFQSVNAGTTWTNISNGLPTLPVNTICYQKGGTADAMYVGTDMGVYYRDTINTGGNWVSYNNGLPNVMIADLKLYAPNNTLMAATYGRGTWSIPTWTPAGTPPVAYFKAFPTSVCTGTSVQFTDTSANHPTSWNWTLTGATPSTSTAQNPNVQYNTAGTYPVKLVAKNASGSDSLTVSGYIYVRQTPPAPTVTINGSLLYATPNTYPYYQWYHNVTVIPGADHDSLWVTAKGIYKVFVTDTNGCTSSTQVVVTVLGVNTLAVDNEMNVYPNPTSGAIQLVFNGQQPGDYELQLSNILGQTVYTENVHLSGTYNSSLNLANYGKGIYFLSLTGNNSRTVKKIVVY